MATTSANLGMFYNVLGMLCKVLGMLCKVLGRPRHAFCNVLGAPHRRETPPCCLISCQGKGVVYHQASIYETWWYTIPLALQLIRQQLGGFFSDVGLLGPCEKACRGCLGCCKACLGRCEAYRGRPRTLPSMPRSCQASLHILGSHKSQC